MLKQPSRGKENGCQLRGSSNCIKYIPKPAGSKPLEFISQSALSAPSWKAVRCSCLLGLVSNRIPFPPCPGGVWSGGIPWGFAKPY